MRDSRTLAASYNTVRTISSPASVIPPVTSFSPDWYFFGVKKSGERPRLPPSILQCDEDHQSPICR